MWHHFSVTGADCGYLPYLFAQLIHPSELSFSASPPPAVPLPIFHTQFPTYPLASGYQFPANVQLLLLQNIAVPLNIFCNAFYSAAMGSDTWIRTNGLMSMAVILHATKFRGDKRFAGKGQKVDPSTKSRIVRQNQPSQGSLLGQEAILRKCAGSEEGGPAGRRVRHGAGHVLQQPQSVIRRCFPASPSPIPFSFILDFCRCWFPVSLSFFSKFAAN